MSEEGGGVHVGRMSLILGRKQRGGNIGLGTWDCGENGESEDDRFVTGVFIRGRSSDASKSGNLESLEIEIRCLHSHSLPFPLSQGLSMNLELID